MKKFKYKGYTFIPVMKLTDKQLNKIFYKGLCSDHELRLSTYCKTYTYKSFYDTCNNCNYDLFKCIENDKIYIPGENELFQCDISVL